MAGWIQLALLIVLLAVTCDRFTTQSLESPPSTNDPPIVFLSPSVANELVQCLQTGLVTTLLFSAGKQDLDFLRKSVLSAIPQEKRWTRKKAQAFENAIVSSLSAIIKSSKRQEGYSENLFITSGILLSCFQDRAGQEGRKYASRLQTLLERSVNSSPSESNKKLKLNDNKRKTFMGPVNFNSAIPPGTKSDSLASSALTVSFTEAFNRAVQLSVPLRKLFHHLESITKAGDLRKIVFDICVAEGVNKSTSKSLAKKIAKAFKSSLKSGMRPNFQYVLSNSIGRFLYDVGVLTQDTSHSLAQDYSNAIEAELKEENPEQDSTLFTYAPTTGTFKFFKSHGISIPQKGYIYLLYFVKELSTSKRVSSSRARGENGIVLTKMNLGKGNTNFSSGKKDSAAFTSSKTNSLLYQAFMDEVSSSFFQTITPSAYIEMSHTEIPASAIRKTLLKYLVKNNKQLKLSSGKSVKKIASKFFKGNSSNLRLSSLISMEANTVAQFLLEKGRLTFQNYVGIARLFSKILSKRIKSTLEPTDADSYLEAIVYGMVDFMIKQNLSGKKYLRKIASIFNTQYNASSSMSETKTEASKSVQSRAVDFPSDRMPSNYQRPTSEYLQTKGIGNETDNYKAPKSNSDIKIDTGAYAQFPLNDAVFPNNLQRATSTNEELSHTFGPMDTETTVASFKSALAASLASVIASSKSLLKMFSSQIPLATLISTLHNILQENYKDFAFVDSIEGLVKSATSNLASNNCFYDFVMASADAVAHILSQNALLTTSNTQKLSNDLTDAIIQGGIQSQSSVSDVSSFIQGAMRGYMNFLDGLNIRSSEDLLNTTSMFNSYLLSTKPKYNMEAGNAFKDLVSMGSPEFLTDNEPYSKGVSSNVASNKASGVLWTNRKGLDFGTFRQSRQVVEGGNTFKDFLSFVSPGFLTDHGLHSKGASSRINNVINILRSDLSQSGGKGLNISTFTTALKSVINQVQKNSPQQSANEVLIESLLESIKALLEVLNESGIRSVDLSKSSNISTELLRALRS